MNKSPEYLEHIRDFAALCWHFSVNPEDVMAGLWAYILVADRQVYPRDLSSMSAYRIAQRISKVTTRDCSRLVECEVDRCARCVGDMKRSGMSEADAVKNLLEMGNVQPDVAHKIASLAHMDRLADRFLPAAMWMYQVRPDRASVLYRRSPT